MKNIFTTKQNGRVQSYYIIVRNHNTSSYGGKEPENFRTKNMERDTYKYKSEYVKSWSRSTCKFNLILLVPLTKHIKCTYLQINF